MPQQPTLPTPSFGVVILAAGASSRMGKPKMLLPWGGISVLGYLIAQWQKAGAGQVAVVVAAGDQALEQELKRLRFPGTNCIGNPTPELGMFSSIQCAGRWTGWKKSLSHWVIALGDQPHLRLETLRSLLNLGATHPRKVCQLSRQGRPRHPVLLPAEVFRQLGHSGHHNLKEFLQSLSSGSTLQECDDAGLDLDIDRPADYERAVRLFGPE